MSEQSYEDSALGNLSKAFESTWETLQADEPHDLKDREELRRFVSERLLELAASGETDPKKLQKQVLEALGKRSPAQPTKTLIDRLGLRSWKGSRTKLESELRG
jgi:hypothetical protein